MDKATILNILKTMKKEEDIIRFCSINQTARKACKEYSEMLFGEPYNNFLYKVAIRKTFPTLHHHISLETLYDYYKDYAVIWKELNKKKRFGDIPMCRYSEDFEYNNYGEPFDPTDPANVSFIAPYHRAIVEEAKNLFFLFFRGADKLPTNIFVMQDDEVITPYIFIKHQQENPNIRNFIYDYTENFLKDPFHKRFLEKYIDDPYWNIVDIAKYYPKRTLREEMQRVMGQTPCDAYPAVGFKQTLKSALFRRHLGLEYPTVEIDFDT